MEVIKLLEENPVLRIPYIDRYNTRAFVDRLYKKGIVYADGYKAPNDFLMEMTFSMFDSTNIRSVLAEIIKTRPYALEEVKRNYFKVNWKFGL